MHKRNQIQTVEYVMSVRKLTATWILGLLMLAGIAQPATAWDWDHQPVMVDPFEFDPDFQWFEPVTNMDLADLKPKKRAHTGWFATYDKLWIHASRPDTDTPERIQLDTKLDSGSGDRYEVGYMLPREDTGWTFTYTDFDVHETDRIGPQLRRLAENFLFGVPLVGMEDPTGVRSINHFDYDSFELNKTWRLEPYHYGGFLEPMIGIRYMNIDDLVQADTYIPPLDDADDEDFGSVISRRAITENDMFGGQIGFRYFKFRNRFTFSTDFRVFAGGSWQCSKAQQTAYDLQLLDLGGGDTGPADVIVTLDRGENDPSVSAPIYARDEQGFVGFDIRTELAYQLTRHLTIRAGVQVVDVATGVWRGGNGEFQDQGLGPGNRNQDLLMVGGTFGLSLNH